MLTKPVHRALLSVSDKKGIVEFAKGLAELNIEIISTGGTCQLLRSFNIPIKEVSELTHFPEIMDGRVKTLHPQIHGGILGRRDEHQSIANDHGIQWIDLVVVNLYPFAETIQKSSVTFDEAIENIDIGGPTMIRSAAKNMEWVGIVVDPLDYSIVLEELKTQHGLSDDMRKRLATKAFAHTAQYDALIHSFLESKPFPDEVSVHLTKKMDLRYGENPHQTAAVYCLNQGTEAPGVLSARQLQGKQLSYNNIMDADAAYTCVRGFQEPACVIVKHANPCGVAVSDDIQQAFQDAYQADPQSAFGGIIALNRVCTKKLAMELSPIFFEVLIAPGFDEEALAVLQKKTSVRLLELSVNQYTDEKEWRYIQGGFLIQDKDQAIMTYEQLRCVTQRTPRQAEINSMLFAWQVLKHIKSNAILIAKENRTIGIGAGQVSRVDAVHMAIHKAGTNITNAILASDAFFPFRDSVDHVAKTGIKAIIQPGGSVRDEEVIQACNEHDIAMMFTGQRCFKH